MPALPALAAQPQRVADPVYGCRVSSKGSRLSDPDSIRCVRLDTRGYPLSLSARVWLTVPLTSRLFKFPQMDFEMAIWEMTSLLIAPKKVFKSIYYHVSVASLSMFYPACKLLAKCHGRLVETYVEHASPCSKRPDPTVGEITGSTQLILFACRYRNQKHLAPSGPLIYIFALLLSPAHCARMGPGLCAGLWLDRSPVAAFYLCPLHRFLAGGIDNSLLCDPTTVWPGWCGRIPVRIPRVSRTEARRGARLVRAAWGEGSTGVWILLRCEFHLLVPWIGLSKEATLSQLG